MSITAQSKTKMPELDAQERARVFSEVNRGYDDDRAKFEALRCLQCQEPECERGCPVMVPIQEMASLIGEGKIEEALANPRDVDMKLVRAQEGRRILDRLYGYSLSPVLWKKVRTKLSAGRVQSVAVRLVVEKEEERQAFKEAEYFDIEGLLTSGDLHFTARLNEVDGVKLAGGKDFDPDTGLLKNENKRFHLHEELAVSLAEAAKNTLPWNVAAITRKETTQRG